MALITYKNFPEIGRGFTIQTQVIPPAGLIPIIRAGRQGEVGLFRYSLDGGVTFTQWVTLTTEVFRNLGSLSDTKDLVLDYVYDPFKKNKLRLLDIYDEPLSSKVYDKSVFKMFFNSNDPAVLTWAVNVLEKLFNPGIVPLYVLRDNEDDYNVFFLTITHFFAFVVVYSRQYRQLENSDILMKEFIEGWGVVYENINTYSQRRYLFTNWINEFRKRGTLSIVETGGTIEGELRRLVGYTTPNEFIFAILAPRDVGWSLGYSSPTWYGTETVNAVSKGWDFGADYVGDAYSNLIEFEEDFLQLPQPGDEERENIIYTNYSWKISVDEEVESNFAENFAAGVGKLTDYPIIGDVKRRFDLDTYVFHFQGTGRVGISTENDKSKVMEVYSGLDYEITVWVKALSDGPQNLAFGVHCYDGNMELIDQIRITDWVTSNTFYSDSEIEYQNPCKVPGIYYRLRGIIYNVASEKEEEIYLNFENGRPLRFMGEVKYMAPYIVQNREGTVSDLYIAGITVKPLDLPFSQGYLGFKNIIAMYAQIKSARTKADIEAFVRRYLVSYKNIVSYTWLDWVVKNSWFLTFYIKRELDNMPVKGATVRTSDGFVATTDVNGFTRLELPMDSNVSWTVEAKGVTVSGSTFMDRDKVEYVTMNLPLNVNITIVPEGTGTATVTGSCLPYTSITLTATPDPGFTFVRWNILTDATSDIRNPAPYFVTTYDLEVEAVFELGSLLSIVPDEVNLPAEGGTALAKVFASKRWAFDPISVPWIEIVPDEGNAGENDIEIKTK